MNSLEQFVGAPLDNARSLAWFGFSADPPTLAHRAIVDAVMGTGKIQKFIVFPAGALDYKSFEATDWQRAEMVEIWNAAAEFGKEVIVSRFDLLRDKAYYWYDLAKEVQKLSPQVQHFFVVGSDAYRDIGSKWQKGRDLFKIARFIVVPREGYPLSAVRAQDILLPIGPLPGSSTETRSGNLQLVDEKVRAYILEEGLYNTSL